MYRPPGNWVPLFYPPFNRASLVCWKNLFQRLPFISRWEKKWSGVHKEGVDLTAVLIRETLVYEIIPGKPMQGMVVVYGYKGRDYDDLSLIVHQQTGKTWLLEIPNPTRVFKMEDTTLRSSIKARQMMAQSDPLLKLQLEM